MWRILLEEFIGDLRTQKLRAFLTTFAITWGTIAIVLLLAFGQGLKDAVYSGLVNAGDRIVMVFGGETSKVYEGLPKGRRIRLTEDDLDLILRTVPGIEMASPSFGRDGVSLEFGKTRTTAYMEGAGPAFEEMRHMYPVEGGRFLDARDGAERRRVAFLGDSLAYRLFGDVDPVGRTLYVDRLPFTVIGVMRTKLQTSDHNGPDQDHIVIPASTFKAIYGERYVDYLAVRPRDESQTEAIKARIYEVLGRRHQFDASDDRALSTWDMVEDGKENHNIGLGIQIFLGVVGGLTLLVAGVGIANVMYVVVRERTREIGVKLAIGARKRHIMAQFTFEALLLSFAGGAVGLLFSAAVVAFVASLPKANMAMQFIANPELPWPIALLVVGILTLIGLAAGLFPARKAAAVDPVESLRYE